MVDDRLWVIGGEDGAAIVRDIEAIKTTDISNAQWEYVASFPTSVDQLKSCGVVSVGDLIYVVGGALYTTDDSMMYIIDTIDGNVQIVPMGFSVNAMSAVVVDNIIYGFGGTGMIGGSEQTLSTWAQYNLLSHEFYVSCRESLMVNISVYGQTHSHYEYYDL